MDALILARALAAPDSVLRLDIGGWNSLLTIAKAERLDATLAHRLDGLPIPARARSVLENARLNAEANRTAALWEAEMARRALAPLGVPVVLLKGAAYAAAGLAAGQGRLIGDLDILVPRDALADVERALLAAGWEWLKQDDYDDAYYRRWMHELPPLIHRERDRMIDVHHTILPLTARPKVDATALIADSVVLTNGLRVLSPEDMIVHAVAHLFADGDLSGGLRNLWDIDQLLREHWRDGFARGLRHHAHRHGLRWQLERAIRLSRAIFRTPVPPYGDRRHAMFEKRLLARDGWGRETHRVLRSAFYLRSHLIRMPLGLLIPHLWTKWRKGLSARP